MKNTIKTIGIITTIIIMLICAYLLGTTQAETITEEKEVIPEGYIDTDSEAFKENYIDMRMVIGYTATADGLQLYFADDTGYYFER